MTTQEALVLLVMAQILSTMLMYRELTKKIKENGQTAKTQDLKKE